jgi:hypothetical protein
VERIQFAAELSIGRAVAFGALAIGTTVLGLIFEPALALKAGGTLTLLMAAILQLKGERAPLRPYRSTEVWLILDRQLGLPDEQAQRIVGAALNGVYERYARISAVVALGLWLLSVAFQFLS